MVETKMILPIQIGTTRGPLVGDLVVPPLAYGAVIFAHGTPRNLYLAERFQLSGFATLLLDFQTHFDMDLRAEILGEASDWVGQQPELRELSLGYFASGTDVGPALVAAGQRSGQVHAVVARGGRPDLAGAALDYVTAATLLIVAGEDQAVLKVNRRALSHLKGPRRLTVVKGASRSFEEPGKLEEVGRLASDWFMRHF